MNRKDIKNIPASIRARLQSLARQNSRPFNEVLQYYAMERFLYRLSKSKLSDKFILKGALLLMTLELPSFRATRDLDFLAITSNDLEEIKELVAQICQENVPPDGLRFETDTIVCQGITKDSDYHGVRVKFKAYLDNSRIDMQIDLGIGDVVHPKPASISYPTLLNDMPEVKLKGYTMESVIAEKLQAMVALGAVNSRIKDFFDIWFIGRNFDFKGYLLGVAIKKTFAHRKTDVPSQFDFFLKGFAQDPVNQTRWAAFQERTGIKSTPEKFEEVTVLLCDFIVPVMESLIGEMPFHKRWKAPGPWI